MELGTEAQQIAISPLHCPLEVCEQVSSAFGRFLREFSIAPEEAPEPSVSLASQGSGERT